MHLLSCKKNVQYKVHAPHCFCLFISGFFLERHSLTTRGNTVAAKEAGFTVSGGPTDKMHQKSYKDRVPAFFSLIQRSEIDWCGIKSIRIC